MRLRSPRWVWIPVAAALGVATVGAAPTDRHAQGAEPMRDVGLLGDIEQWDGATTDDRRSTARDVAERAPGFVFDRMERFRSGTGHREVAIFVHEATGIEFSLVPAGSFTQGSTADAIWKGDARSPGPPHRTTLREPFLIARTEITQLAFQRVMGRNPSHFRGDSLPVESVKWSEAVAFCRKTGLTLPTEAQWERACRAGTTGRYSFEPESATPTDRAWTAESSGGTTHPVASLEPNGLGLFDVHGNVWEWMADVLSPYSGDEEVDPTGPARNTGVRVVRSGSWDHEAYRAEASARCCAPEGERWSILGFRPVAVVHARETLQN